MKSIKLIIISLFISLCAFSETIQVNNALELLNAIKSNCTIILAEGEYNISEIIADVDNPNIDFIDNFDGPGPLVQNVTNLTLSGKGKATLVIEPRYSWVVNFFNCDNVNIEGLTFGHTNSGYCQGGVLGFESCTNINIEKCSLYGCGTVGIMTRDCSNLAVKSCDIYECSYGLLYLYDSENISFEKTKFRKTGEFDLIEISGCKNVSFTKCIFSENFNDNFMPNFFAIYYNIYSGESVENSGIIKIHKCKFSDNKVSQFTNEFKKLDLRKNKFSGNTFYVPEQ